MIQEATAAEIRSKISDTHTLPVSAYDPNGLESLETSVQRFRVIQDDMLLTIAQAWYLARCDSRQIWHGSIPHKHSQPRIWLACYGPRDRANHEQRDE